MILGLFFYKGFMATLFSYLRKISRHRAVIILLSLALLLVIWNVLLAWFDLPAFILPSPRMVLDRFLNTLIDGSLLRHLATTLTEVLAGLLTGGVSAILLGYLLSRSHWLDRLISPFLVASQAVPVVAIAPLLIIWFGSGLGAKVLICALIVFFPVLINTVVGLREVPETLRDLMRSLQATHLQMACYLELPAALPVLLGGFRIGATLSVIGAVVGEFISADSGLGYLINVGRGQYDTALVFAAIFTLVGLALFLYGLVVLLEHRLLRWKKNPLEVSESL
jgi:NitT/TauT family transport system permease protein